MRLIVNFYVPRVKRGFFDSEATHILSKQNYVLLCGVLFGFFYA